MRKFIIRTNVGFGSSYEIVDASDEEDANNLAYDSWREQAEANADYDVIEYSKENCKNYDLDWEEDRE